MKLRSSQCAPEGRGWNSGAGAVDRVSVRWQRPRQSQRLRPVPVPDSVPASPVALSTCAPNPQPRHYPRLSHRRARRRGDTVPTAQNARPFRPMIPGAVGKQRHPRSNGDGRSRTPMPPMREAGELRTGPLNPTRPISRSPVVAHNCEYHDLIFTNCVDQRVRITLKNLPADLARNPGSYIWKLTDAFETSTNLVHKSGCNGSRPLNVVPDCLKELFLSFLVKPDFSHSGGALPSVAPHLPESILPFRSEDHETFAPPRLPRVSRPLDPRDHRDFSRASPQARPAYPTAIQTLDGKVAQCFSYRQYIRGPPAESARLEQWPCLVVSSRPRELQRPSGGISPTLPRPSIRGDPSTPARGGLRSG